MNTLYDYLSTGLLLDDQLRPELEPHIREVANQWLQVAVEVEILEVLAEFLARTAQALEGDNYSYNILKNELLWLSLSSEVIQFLSVACGDSGSSNHLAAVAIHLLDIAELVALKIYVPELPALYATADRTGDASRQVGIARHLRG